MVHMSHRVTYYSFTRTIVYCVLLYRCLPVCCRIKRITRVLVISRVLVTLFVSRRVVSSEMWWLLDR